MYHMKSKKGIENKTNDLKKLGRCRNIMKVQYMVLTPGFTLVTLSCLYL